MSASNIVKKQAIKMTKLIKLLFLLLLLSGARVSAQTQVVDLRDFKRVSDNNRGNPEGYYFEDQHHDLDKFTGEWEGMGFGNHLWRVHIIVQKKANYYSRYWSDALGLEISITKDGKACITPTGSLLPGTSFIKGWGLFWDTEKRSLLLDVYKVPFIYGKADKPAKIFSPCGFETFPPDGGASAKVHREMNQLVDVGNTDTRHSIGCVEA